MLPTPEVQMMILDETCWRRSTFVISKQVCMLSGSGASAPSAGGKKAGKSPAGEAVPRVKHRRKTLSFPIFSSGCAA